MFLERNLYSPHQGSVIIYEGGWGGHVLYLCTVHSGQWIGRGLITIKEGVGVSGFIVYDVQLGMLDYLILKIRVQNRYG
jgi:hypothetical protein